MKTVGVVLSGCGFRDGAEIHESVITLLALDRAGARAVCMAPNVPQAHVINHLTGKETGEIRNALVEAARIARGRIHDLQSVAAQELDALILPGGYGVVQNLSTFAAKGANCTVNGELTRLIKELHQAGKPIGAICIAPVVLAKIFGGETQLELTVGTDPETAHAIDRMGARHTNRAVTEIVTDMHNRVVSTPAYMSAQRISEAATGIEALVAEVLRMTGMPRTHAARG